MHAITHADAKAKFSAANIAALEAGDEHGLTAADVAAAGTEFRSNKVAREYLRANGGGWIIDDDGDSTWIA